MWNKMPKANKYIFKGSKENHSIFFFFWEKTKAALGSKFAINDY